MTRPAQTTRPRPPEGARSWILLVLDSCRWDSFTQARAPHLHGLGPVERRWSSATWTAPAHLNMLMGLLPHAAQPGSWASEVYARDLARYSQRLGVQLDMAQLAPGLWLPTWLQSQGWVTGAWLSLPVLNEATVLNRGFDHYSLRSAHNDLRGIIDALRFYDRRPSFWLINAGETHYPYECPHRLYEPLPHLSGVHGTVRRAGQTPRLGVPRFEPWQLEDMHRRQVEAVEYVDSLMPRLRSLSPPGTWLTVTADHGECFGEGGWFGHGPVPHPKVLEVPWVEAEL